MSSSILHVVGEVVGKQRPRLTTVGGAARAYTPAKTVAFENDVKDAYLAQGGKYHKGPVTVTIAYRRPMPTSRSKRTRKEWDVYKPDVDNVAKSVLDALNGIAYEDDKCVVQLTVSKLERARDVEEELYVQVSDARAGISEWMEGLWQRFMKSTAR